MTQDGGALHGITVVELGGGAGGAWCGRMLAELGATVRRCAPAAGDPLASRREVPDAAATAGLLHAWLNGGKRPLDRDGREAAVADSDLLILGEEASGDPPDARPRCATVDLSWFGRTGPYAGWHGADLAVQALCGIAHPAGPVEGPPRWEFTTTSGNSAMIAKPIASVFRAIPGPELEVTPRPPA